MKHLLLVLSILFLTSCSSKLYVVNEHTYTHITKEKVHIQKEPFNNIPYIGKVGLEYQTSKKDFGFGYMHRVNIDNTDDDEYNYNGFYLSFKYKKCILNC